MNHSNPCQPFTKKRIATPFAPLITGIEVALGDYDENRSTVTCHHEGQKVPGVSQLNNCISTKKGFEYSKTLINEPLCRADMPEILKMDQEISMHVYEDVALVAADYIEAMACYATDGSMDYSKAWHGAARFAMGEFYFNPQLSGNCKVNAKALQHTIWDALKLCDEQIRGDLLQNIRVTSKVNIRGFGERLEAELKLLASFHGFDDVEINVKTPKCWECPDHDQH